jgi:transposase-like protein
MTLTKEQVFAAADALDEAGVKATVQDVRARVGGGSFTTLSAWLNDWRVRRAADLLVSEDLAAARARVEQLETSRRELQARIQALEIALLSAQRRLAPESSGPDNGHDGRRVMRDWNVLVNSR